MRAIVCGLPLDSGSTAHPEPEIEDILNRKYAEERYFYDNELGACRKFKYEGHGGNLNNFLTAQECKEICGQDFKGKAELTALHVEEEYFSEVILLLMILYNFFSSFFEGSDSPAKSVI